MTFVQVRHKVFDDWGSATLWFNEKLYKGWRLPHPPQIQDDGTVFVKAEMEIFEGTKIDISYTEEQCLEITSKVSNIKGCVIDGNEGALYKNQPLIELNSVLQIPEINYNSELRAILLRCEAVSIDKRPYIPKNLVINSILHFRVKDPYPLIKNYFPWLFGDPEMTGQ